MLWGKFSWLGITLWRFSDLSAILLFEVLIPEMYFSNYFTNAIYSGKNNFLCLLSVLMFMCVLSATLCQEKFVFKWLTLMTPELFSQPTFFTLDICPCVCLPWNSLSNVPIIPSKLLLYKSSVHFLVLNSTSLWSSAFYPKCGKLWTKTRSSESCRHSQHDSTFMILSWDFWSPSYSLFHLGSIEYVWS